MNENSAIDETNADASETSTFRDLGVDGDDGEEFRYCHNQSRSPNQDDTDTHALGDGTSNAPASPLPLPTGEMETADEDDPPMPASQKLAAAFEEIEEGFVMESPTAPAAPLNSTGLSPTPPPVRPASTPERQETLEDKADEGPSPAPGVRSPLPRARMEFLNEGMPPMPAFQTAAANIETDQNIWNNSRDAPSPQLPPMPAVQSAADKDMEQDIGSSMDGDTPPSPMPPMQVDLTGAIFKDEDKGLTAYEKMKTIEKYDSQQAQDHPTPVIVRAPFPTAMDFESTITASLQRMRERVRHHQEEILQQAQGPPTPTEEDAQHPSENRPVRTESLPAITTQLQAGAIPLGITQSAIVLPMRPPPRSMLPFPEDDDDVTNASSDIRFHRVEATLYEQDSVVYLGTPVEDDLRTWWKKQRIPIAIAVIGLVAGSAVALWATLGSDRETIMASSQPSKTQSSLSSLEPSQSSSPSEIPSLRPTFHPSQSVALSSVRSSPPSTSLLPSTQPASSFSTPPSASNHPTPFCFEGTINIFTDSHPEDTSWTLSALSRITTEGVANATVVREGSSEDESSPHAYEVCLERGEYEFTIYDSFGDGICCDTGSGHFELVLDGWVVLEGGEFGFTQTISFSLPATSLPPSQSSVPSRSLSPTFRPSTSFGPSSQVPSLGPTLSLRPSSFPSLLSSAPPSTYWSSLVWEQQGQTIKGEARGDESGRSVVISGDGTTMAIGSPGARDNNDRPGYVKVYHREDNASGWQHLGQKIEGTANGNQFGEGLALSEDGRTLVIGAPGHFRNSNNPGYVRVYQMEGDVPGSIWKQLGQDIEGLFPGDRSGYSVGLSLGRMTLAIGAPFNEGLVRIYGWDEDGGRWKQLGQNIVGKGPRDKLGYSMDLSLDGMTVAIGAPWNDGNGEASGQVRVFRREGDEPIWEQLGQDINGEDSRDLSGHSVSLSSDGRTLAIGANKNDGNGVDAGHARVYRIDDGDSRWEQIGQDIDGEANGDMSGFSLSLSADGKTLAIGAIKNDLNGPNTGHVRVYRMEDGRNWQQVGPDIDGGPCDNAGYDVSLSADGKTVAIGSPGTVQETVLNSGHVRVFNVNY